VGDAPDSKPSPTLLARLPDIDLTLDDALVEAFEGASHPVWVYDPFERYALRWGNAPALRIWRCDSLESLRARDFSDDTDVTIRMVEAQIDDMLDGGFPLRWTLYPDGVPTVVVAQVRAVRVGADHVGFLAEVATVETGTTPESSRMHMAVHYIDALLTVFTAEGSQLMQNPAAARAYPRRKGVSRSWASRFEDPADHARAAAAVLAGEAYRGELEMKTQDGVRWHAVHAYRSKDPATGDDAIVVHEASIERLRRAEEGLREKNALLEQSLQELRDTQARLVLSEKMATLGNLVAGLAHEINTPMGAMISSAMTGEKALEKLSIAVTEGSPEKRDRYLRAASDSNQVIRDAAQRVAELVTTLESFAALDQADMQRSDLNDQLRQTLTLVQHRVTDSIRLETELGELPAIACHPRQLNQVFLNLITNALQSIAARVAEDGGRGTLRIETRAEESWVVVELADDGVGIADGHLDRLFEPAFTTKRDRVGAGLGLPICYRIVDEHGGQIHAASGGAGKGATFTVRLPIR